MVEFTAIPYRAAPPPVFTLGRAGARPSPRWRPARAPPRPRRRRTDQVPHPCQRIKRQNWQPPYDRSCSCEACRLGGLVAICPLVTRYVGREVRRLGRELLEGEAGVYADGGISYLTQFQPVVIVTSFGREVNPRDCCPRFIVHFSLNRTVGVGQRQARRLHWQPRRDRASDQSHCHCVRCERTFGAGDVTAYPGARSRATG